MIAKIPLMCIPDCTENVSLSIPYTFFCMINDEPWHHLTDHKQDISLMLTQVHHHSCCSAEP